MNYIVIPAYQPDNKLIKLIEKIHEKSDFHILVIDDGSSSKCQKIFDKAKQFATVIRHQVNQGKGQAMASNPRTAIGIIDENHYIIVVSDGRTSESEGLSLYQLAEVMKSYGAKTAYNLDGGGSSTLYFNGQVINKPTTGGNKISERAVSDIVYIGY